MSSTQALGAARIRSASFNYILPVLLVFAVLLFLVGKMEHGLDSVMWLDESWTGAFSSLSSFKELTKQIRDDPNAPIYSYFMWAWARFFGLSNISLHAPSLVFSVAAPVLSWALMRSSRPGLALGWTILLSTWAPGFLLFSLARCYSLLFLMATLSTIAHLRLLEGPILRRAVVWVACATAMTLVHYHAGILALAQGLAVFIHLRRRVIRLWPASLLVIPGVIWMAWHAPRLAEFGSIDVAWYPRLRADALPTALFYLVSGPLPILALIIALLGRLIVKEPTSETEEEQIEVNSTLLWVGSAALAAGMICILIGMVRPTFTFRYLTPFVPGTLLLLAGCAFRIGKFRAIILLSAGSFGAAALALSASWGGKVSVYNFEVASAWIAKSNPSRVVFFWDHPATAVETPSQLDIVGGFFLRRAGLPTMVTPLYPTADDMNKPTLAAAGQDAAILWMYDTAVHDTRARNYPPRLAALNSDLECRDFGEKAIGVMACRRQPPK